MSQNFGLCSLFCTLAHYEEITVYISYNVRVGYASISQGIEG